jgi:hypothetical protein
VIFSRNHESPAPKLRRRRICSRLISEDSTRASSGAANKNHAFVERVVDGIVLCARQGPCTSTSEHDGSRTSVDSCANEPPRSPLIHQDNLDSRELLETGDIELAACGMALESIAEEHNSVTINDADKSVVAASKRVKTIRVRLNNIPSGVDFIIHDNQDTTSLGGRQGGDPHCL